MERTNRIQARTRRQATPAMVGVGARWTPERGSGYGSSGCRRTGSGSFKRPAEAALHPHPRLPPVRCLLGTRQLQDRLYYLIRGGLHRQMNAFLALSIALHCRACACSSRSRLVLEPKLGRKAVASKEGEKRVYSTASKGLREQPAGQRELFSSKRSTQRARAGRTC